MVVLGFAWFGAWGARVCLVLLDVALVCFLFLHGCVWVCLVLCLWCFGLLGFALVYLCLLRFALFCAWGVLGFAWFCAWCALVCLGLLKCVLVSYALLNCFASVWLRLLVLMLNVLGFVRVCLDLLWFA